jgi:DNA primase
VSGLIPEQVIAEIRERTDIVQVIGQHVQLKRSGANHLGLCPFHDEKTPSFNVNPRRQSYHCFGCHESGDVFSFLMKVEGRRFMEVVEDLAARAGIELPKTKLSPADARREAARKSERQQGLDLNKRVAERYRQLLLGSEGQAARDYLRKRAVGDEMSELFRLGFAPASGNVVVELIRLNGLDPGLAERMGLVAARREGKGHHDRFWNRLMFPIIDARGEVLGFGGRLLGDGDGPKYINTPETAFYHKGDVLYGLHAAQTGMRKSGQALIVEGNIDVIQAHQHGFGNAVAPMGTALTAQQVQLMKRFAGDVVALFDGDEAGNKAALKAVRTLVEGGITSGKIASLPAGQDPDDFLRKEGREALEGVLKRALPAVDFLIDELRRRTDNSIPARARELEEVAPILAQLPLVDQRLYTGRLAVELQMDVALVRRVVGGGVVPPELRRGAPKPEAPPAPPPLAELDLLGILLDHPHLFQRAEAAGVQSLLTNDGLRDTYVAAMQMQQATGRIEHAKVLQAAPTSVRDEVFKLSGQFASDCDPTRALDDCLSALQRAKLKCELQEVRDLMGKAKAAGDDKNRLTLTARKVELERKIHETR